MKTEKPEKIIEPGRENAKLTKMAEKVYEIANEYSKENELHCLVLMADKEGGASFTIGDEKKIAKEFKESGNVHPIFKKIMNLIKK
ncbi:hypothetical protein [Prevotella sp. 885]|uniref:hypothetical protein n=1 Tax=Prevotella sp. 885 TaxID=2022527 RepID=UPI000BA13CB7|nr:hypothetical protein [Prevotella sp. 885]OZT04998.1 hypothetical protein CHL74_02060 [Prevotella sp. 885]